ncbi:MAG TPA: hypothetical protein PKB12_08935, partial [Elusimicrobiota bacterium]|nr:hypothetical protein [Elusimicrobiota bacterium]
MSLFRRFKIFWMNNWVNITIIVSLILLLILSIWGLFALESFYRTLTLATLPLNLLMAVMNALVFVYLYTHVLQGGFGKMGRKMQINADDFKVTFKDVIGLENAKKEAMEVVALLKDRARVKAIGGSIIKGLLMVGPPGTGKTLLAKA